MKKSFNLMAILLGLMAGSFAFTACSDDDDESNPLDTVMIVNPEDSVPPIKLDLQNAYKVTADLNGIQWEDSVYVTVRDNGTFDLSLSAKDMPQEGAHIENAKIQNLFLLKDQVKNTNANFAASVSMAAAAGMPVKEYSTLDENAQLTITSFEGTATKDSLFIKLGLQAGKMPLTIPLTITSVSE